MLVKRTSGDYLKLEQAHITFLVKQTTLMTQAVADSFDLAFRVLRMNDLDAFEDVFSLTEKIERYHNDIERVLKNSHRERDRDARDVQQMGALLKIIIHLQKIGQTVHTVAKGGVALYSSERGDTLDMFDVMCDIVSGMLHHIAYATSERIITPLYGFGERKKEILSISNNVLTESAEYVLMHPERANDRVCYLRIVEHIKEMAEDACKIAEQCIFTETGEFTDLQ